METWILVVTMCYHTTAQQLWKHNSLATSKSTWLYTGSLRDPIQAIERGQMCSTTLILVSPLARGFWSYLGTIDVSWPAQFQWLGNQGYKPLKRDEIIGHHWKPFHSSWPVTSWGTAVWRWWVSSSWFWPMCLSWSDAGILLFWHVTCIHNNGFRLNILWSILIDDIRIYTMVAEFAVQHHLIGKFEDPSAPGMLLQSEHSFSRCFMCQWISQVCASQTCCNLFLETYLLSTFSRFHENKHTNPPYPILSHTTYYEVIYHTTISYPNLHSWSFKNSTSHL